MKLTALLFAALLVSAAAHASDTINFCDEHKSSAGNGTTIAIPTDDAPIQTPDNPLDEWFWWGRLHALDGRAFHYEVFFFRFTPAPGENLLWAQVSITDLQTGAFHQGSTLIPGLYPTSTNGFDLSLPVANSPTAKGGSGNGDHVTITTGDGLSLDLISESLDNPMIQFLDGHATYTDPATGATSGDNYYYSRPELATAGTLTIGGEKLAVVGESWFDREWHACCFNGPVAWDWYGISLANGSHYMVYDVYVPGHRDQIMSRTVNIEGAPLQCSAEALDQSSNQFTLGHSGGWTSPNSGFTYPTEFTLDIPSQDTHLVVHPSVANQELTEIPSFFSPWYEGGATVTGVEHGVPASGIAQVELFGYQAGAQ